MDSEIYKVLRKKLSEDCTFWYSKYRQTLEQAKALNTKEAVIANGGFDAPVRFFQAGLIHGWYGKRLSGDERPD